MRHLRHLALIIDAVPAQARKYVYALIALAALGWSAYEAAAGDWVEMAGGVIVALANGLATRHTPKRDRAGGYRKHAG